MRNTQLKDRTLWFDGDSSFNPSDIVNLSSTYQNILYVDEMNDEVYRFNKNVPKSSHITIKTQCGQLTHDWVIPCEYKALDIIEYICDKHVKMTTGLTITEIDKRDYRLISELALYKKYGLLDILRPIIWIINTLSEANVVYGVGRGSSVSSYVLYVIGVHDVDSYHYDLDINDFLHK